MQINRPTNDPTITVRRSTVVIGIILGYFVIKQVARTNFVEGYGEALADTASNLARS